MFKLKVIVLSVSMALFGCNGSDDSTSNEVQPEKPSIENKAIQTEKNEYIVASLNDSTNNISGSYSIKTEPEHGTVELINPQTGEIKYTPDFDFVGSESFIYGYGSLQANVTVEVLEQFPVDEIIVSHNDFYAVRSNGSTYKFGTQAQNITVYDTPSYVMTLSDWLKPDNSDVSQVFQNKYNIRGASSTSTIGERADKSLFVFGQNINLSPSTLEAFKCESACVDVKIANTENPFFGMMLNEDGNAYTWGVNIPDEDQALFTDIESIYVSETLGVAIKDNGTPIFVGAMGIYDVQDHYDPKYDGFFANQAPIKDFYFAAKTLIFILEDGEMKEISSKIPMGTQIPFDVSLHDKTKEVVKVASSFDSGFLLYNDGSYQTWGNNAFGAEIPDEYQAILAQRKIIDVVGAHQGFALLLDDGSVLSWSGFYADEFIAPASVNGDVKVKRLFGMSGDSGIITAVREDGLIVHWGSVNPGNGYIPLDHVNSVINDYSDIKDIKHTTAAFAVLLKNGEVHSWGKESEGATTNVLHNVKAIHSNFGAFLSVHEDGSLSSWGNARFGAGGHLLHDGKITPFQDNNAR
ncbi:hypothetical protein GNP80_20340 [Aliivibrio fischeri]|uniref:Ig-like domain-containing protein n=1 Tax=Aliivibrio fischeri TaxID=668 RepID=UPI0012DA89DA|nr:Ig-like domain-containing protein [Aliivibrio fischeri]MUK94763.1 hypothetical protein [Aliivibrio fischeri]